MNIDIFKNNIYCLLFPIIAKLFESRLIHFRRKEKGKKEKGRKEKEREKMIHVRKYGKLTL